MVHLCGLCSKQFSKKYNLIRHQNEMHGEDVVVFECFQCGAKFNRKLNLQRHEQLMHTKKSKLDDSTIFKCDTCGENFSARWLLTRHVMTHSSDEAKPSNLLDFKCKICAKKYNSQCLLTRHMAIHSKEFQCDQCKKYFARKEHLAKHIRINCEITKRQNAHCILKPTNITTINYQPSSSANDNTSSIPSNSFPKVIGEFEQIETAFNCRLLTYRLQRLSTMKLDLPLFLTFIFEKILYLLTVVLDKFQSSKVNIFVECEFININGEICQKNFKTKNVPLFQGSDLEDICVDMFEKLICEKEECQLKGSGWVFVKVNKFEVRVNKYNPLRGKSHIPLPKHLKGIVNVENSDDMCFRYAVLAKFVTGNAKLPSNYSHELLAKYDWSCLKFPVALCDIPKFEERNNMSINVFSFDEKNNIFPLKVCDRPKAAHIDLILLTSMTNNTHYVYIKDFNKMISQQLTHHKGAIYACKKCFTNFNDEPNRLGLTGQQRLNEHERYCQGNAPLRLDLSKEPFIQFKNEERSQRVRFVIYGDFECALEPITSTEVSPARNTHTHMPHSYCYLIKDSLSNTTIIRQDRGEHAAKKFVQSLRSDVLMIGDILYKERQLQPQLNDEDKTRFEKASQCHICKKEFTDEDTKVRDHMHSKPFTFRGAAHASCNLRHQEQTTINCYFHNLGYDSHFIIKELAYDECDISVIANTEENYVTFAKVIPFHTAKHKILKLRFVDTFRFLPSSLSKLASNLPKDCFRETRKEFPEEEKFQLVTRKGVFPYNHITSIEILNETNLPSKEQFYNTLTLQHVSDEDYDHAHMVWNTFNIKNLGEYSDLYLKTDVLLLADVFENFRDTSLRTHVLDPAYYVTLPSYAWDCMLKMTGVKLETLQDFDMHLFFEKGIRGGISQCCTRRAVANNKHCKVFDINKSSKYISYLDATNLYGYAQSQYLPTGGFQWLDQTEIENLQIETVPDTSDIGYVLEVDVSYPESLHDIHNYLPFLCETKIPPNGKHRKLLTTLEDKKNYVVHYRILNQATRHGLTLEKIHRVIRFNQSPWLKSYIELNTELRKNAKNNFERDLFKLYNNSVFGKFMENVRKRKDYRLATTGDKLDKLVCKPNFLYSTVFSESLVGVNMAKTSVVLEKPIYVGMCILDISKELMYSFFYDVLIPHYGVEHLKLLYMDTDSFILEINTNDLYVSMLPILDYLDTSSYTLKNPAYSERNRGVLGKMKDKTPNMVILEFLGLRSKMYCVVPDDLEKRKVIKRCKGINKPVVGIQINVDDYRKCVTEGEYKYTVNTNFRSFKHTLVTRSENKLSLSPHDDKRALQSNGIDTYAHGHYILKKS